MILSTVMTAALLAALLPGAPTELAKGPRVFRNVNAGMCLTYGTYLPTGQTIAAVGNCTHSMYTLWKRTARSQFAAGSMCLGRPTGPADERKVLVGRCASDAKGQRLTFTKLGTEADGDHYMVNWQGTAPGLCLAANLKGQVFPNPCERVGGNTTWVVVRFAMD
ncbi:hypothetical protein ACQP2T_43160 [Nonomuraea sp. CA-143628]|uniref:hypothetical protein n=1 Tax=Nonomuraea sp. CA-143628 TaxID=3239997 RepID=UPI003D8CDD8A